MFPIESVYTGKEKTGIISSLTAGAKTNIVSTPIFGFGPAVIRIRAGIVIQTVYCYLMGSRVIINSPGFINHFSYKNYKTLGIFYFLFSKIF